jgi:fructokinase
MPRFITTGELLIDFVSTESGLTIGEHIGGHETPQDAPSPSFIPAPGGAPANVAVGIALLGGDVGFIGKVGDDPFGKRLIEVMDEYDVDTTAVSVSDEARTMLAFVSLTKEGERDFAFFRHPSADMLLTRDDIPGDYLSETAYFHFGSIGLITEPSRGTTLSLVEEAKAAGATISFDPNLRPPLWPDDRAMKDEIMAVIPMVDIIKLSAEEAFFLTGEANPKQAAKLILMMGPRLVTVTLGREGSVAVTARYGVEIAGYPVETIDTTGAGDAFTAAMLVMLSETGTADPILLGDLDMINIFRFANAAGALATTRRGAIPALPQREAVEGLLRAKKNT